MRKIRKTNTIVVLILACIFGLFKSPSILRKAMAEPGKVTIIRVVDGDTLKIQADGKNTSTRLIGIDTPESGINEKALRDAKRTNTDINTIVSQGQKAKEFVESLVKPGDSLSIEYDVERHDKYGRLLGYIYLADGRMLNEAIIKAGYASPMTIQPNVQHQELFLSAYREAREKGRGLWH